MKSSEYIFVVLFIFNNYILADHLVCNENFTKYYDIHNDLENSASTIYLISSDDTEHQNINEDFNKTIHVLGFEVKLINGDAFCTDGFNATLAVANYFENVINLKAKVTHDYDHPKLSAVAYLGEYLDPEKKQEVTLCRHGNAKRADNDEYIVNGINYNETCDYRTTSSISKYNFVYVRLATESIQKYHLLFQNLLDFSKNQSYPYLKNIARTAYTRPFKENDVLVCGFDHLDTKKFKFENGVNVVKNCKTVERFKKFQISSALVDKPLGDEERTLMPVIFYNLPYLLEEDAAVYPHGMVLFKDYFRLLSEGVMELMRINGWFRVAVLSDDSPYSVNFQSNLTTLFAKHKILNTPVSMFDLEKGLKKLKHHPPTLIVANVEEELVDDIIKIAKKIGLHSSNAMWIWRDWPSNKLIVDLSNTFSISVGPDVTPRYPHVYDNINEAIEVSIQAVAERNKASNIEEPRYLTDAYQKLIAKSKAIRVNLRNVHVRSQGKTYFSVRINKSKKEVLINYHIRYNEMGCWKKGIDFFKACDDMNVVSIILVILILLLIIIIGYIGKKELIDRRPRRRYTYRLFS